MANGLTGEFDVVVEVRVGAVNRILATLHQNGASKDASPSFLHKLAVRVGPVFKRSDVAFWLGGGANESSSKYPPGVSEVADQANAEMTKQQAELLKSTIVRGTAQVQLSTPTITFPEGSTSDVVAHVQLRAHYMPDPGTRPLPEPIHGEVRATFLIDPIASRIGKNLLEVKPTTDDSKIRFVPAAGTGLSAADAEKISEQIRIVLRDRFEPTNVQLPGDFKLFRFRALSTGPGQVIALPLKLSGPQPPPAAIAGVTNEFLEAADHFAVAISKEFIESLVQQLKDGLKAFHTTFKASFWVVYGLIPIKHTVTYNVTVSSVQLTWQTGSIKLTVKASAKTSSWYLPDYNNITIEQTLTLTLDTATQTFSLEHVGPPSISGLPGFAADKVKSTIIELRNEALQAVQSKIQNEEKLTGGVTLGGALKSFDSSASATYTSLRIQGQGVILGGTVSVNSRSPAVVDFTETGDGMAFTAFKSWIPAGTVDRYVWSWLSLKPGIVEPWKWAKYNEIADEHRFILQRPRNLPPGGDVCLRVEGTQVSSAGALGVQGASDEHTSACQINGEELVLSVPSWWDTLMAVPIWLPDPAPDMVLDSAIAAHVSAVAQSRASTEAGVNSLVHFAGGHSAKSMEMLGRALRQSRRSDAPVTVILVLPLGSFQNTGPALEQKLGSLGREFSASIAVTEDYEEGWTRTFGVERTPATYLMNASGELVWQQAGPLDAASLTAALDQRLTSGSRPRSRLLRLAVRPGDRAPDFLFEYAGGRQMALRKLRGQMVLLNFWKSWSAPCLAELRHLERVHARAGREAALILAINGGEDPRLVAQICREHHLTFTVVPDPHHRISRRYQVNCWPTTVSIDENGRVHRVHFGVTPERSYARALAEAPLPRRGEAESS